MKKLMVLAALAAMFAGCTATKIEFEQNKEGETKYSIWHNDHWMKTSTERMAGGMSKDGQFSVELAGRDSSPSEEFNRTMQTYTTAFVQLAQIAAAAYNPSASQAVSTATKSANTATPQTTVVNVQPATTTNAVPTANASATSAAKSFTDSLSSAGLAMLSDYITNKKSGTIEVEKKDGTKETVTCENGKCTLSDGTTITAEDCEACKDCTVNGK